MLISRFITAKEDSCCYYLKLLGKGKQEQSLKHKIILKIKAVQIYFQVSKTTNLLCNNLVVPLIVIFSSGTDFCDYAILPWCVNCGDDK